VADQANQVWCTAAIQHLDAILNKKYFLGVKNGISFQYAVDDLSQIPLEDIDAAFCRRFSKKYANYYIFTTSSNIMI
jgi:hypothetical protein